MSVRFLPTCLISTTLLTATLVAYLAVPCPGLRAGDDVNCPKCAECLLREYAAQPACCEKMETRTYSVADLVIPCGNACNAAPQPAPAPCPIPAAQTCPAANAQICAPPRTTEKELIKLIVHAVAPETWAEKGGKGAIDYFPATMSLVVNQTHDVHTQIADMFKAMRRHQDVQVALEVRFVTVCEPFIERIGIEFECQKSNEPQGPCPKECKPADDVKVTFLNEKQVFQLLEAVQGGTQTNIMQAPKLSMLNGQCSTLDVSQQKTFVTGLQVMQIDGQVICKPVNEVITTGVRMNVQPVVSADRRFVRVHLNANLDSLDSPDAELIPVQVPIPPKFADGTPSKLHKPVLFTQFIQKPRLNKVAIDRTLSIPDGGTVVLSGWKQVREVRKEFGPPILSKIPHINRLFKNVGYHRETERLLVMVTPRVIVPDTEVEDPFEDPNGFCWPFGNDPVPCPAPVKDKHSQDSAVRPTVKVLDPGSPNGFRDVLITGEEQSTGSCKVGAGVTSNAGFTGSIVTSCEVAGLLEQYHKACAEGRRAEATELAVRALALDPACFHKAAGNGKSAK